LKLPTYQFVAQRGAAFAVVASLSLLAVASARAEQLLCIVEVVALVTISLEGKEIEGHVYDQNIVDTKFIFSDSSGVWRAKNMEDDYWTFNRCEPEGFICEYRPENWEPSRVIAVPMIIRNGDSTFYARETRQDDDWRYVVTSVGKCSEF
jgi:hypothetical protein